MVDRQGLADQLFHLFIHRRDAYARQTATGYVKVEQPITEELHACMHEISSNRQKNRSHVNESEPNLETLHSADQWKTDAFKLAV